MHTSTPTVRNRITALFGIDHPILLGGMHYLGRSDLVAAVVNAGAMGFITPRSFDSLDEYRQDLRRCRDLTQGRAFGVNLTISRRPGLNLQTADWLEIALEEGVHHFESAGTSPDEIVQAVHAGGGVLIHKCPSVRHALTAERAGVDAVALVGMEEGGHPGSNQLSTFVNGAVALNRLRIPVVVGGGIGCGRQIAAALAMGAEGVVMGSRFVVASETQVHTALKEHIVALDEHCSISVLGTLNDTWRVMVNETAREVQRLEAAGARRHEEFGDLILSSRTRQRVYREGRIDEGLVSLGPAGGFADAIEPAGVIVNRLVAELRHAVAGLNRSMV